MCAAFQGMQQGWHDQDATNGSMPVSMNNAVSPMGACDWNMKYQ